LIDVTLTNREYHECMVLGADTVKVCEMQGFKPRLENKKQSRVEANQLGFMAEFAVAKVFDLDKPGLNITSDGGADLWWNDRSIDVKFTNRLDDGLLIFDSEDSFGADLAVLVAKTPRKKVFRVLGWVDKDTFVSGNVSHDFGYGPRLVMKADDLFPVEEMWLRMIKMRLEINND
jgi:hypothetical protein